MKINRYQTWLEEQIEEGTLTQNTADSYYNAVRKFSTWADPADAEEPTPSEIEAWLYAMADAEGLSAATIRNHFYGVKNYHHWHPELDEDDVADLRDVLDDVAEHDSDSRPPALSDDQIQALEAGAATAADHRVGVVVHLLRLTGMTSAELRRLDLADVDLDAGTVHVDRPDRPEWVHRHYSLTDDARAALTDYLDHRGDYGDPTSAALLVTQRGRASADMIQSLLRDAADAADVDATVTPTRVRNWVGFKLAREGFGAREIAAYLGLSSLQQAGRYLPADADADRSDQLRDALLRS